MQTTRWTVQWDPTADTGASDMAGAYKHRMALGDARGYLEVTWGGSEDGSSAFDVVWDQPGQIGLMIADDLPNRTLAMAVGAEWAVAMGWLREQKPGVWELLEIEAGLPEDVFKSGAGSWDVKDIIGSDEKA